MSLVINESAVHELMESVVKVIDSTVLTISEKAKFLREINQKFLELTGYENAFVSEKIDEYWSEHWNDMNKECEKLNEESFDKYGCELVSKGLLRRLPTESKEYKVSAILPGRKTKVYGNVFVNFGELKIKGSNDKVYKLGYVGQSCDWNNRGKFGKAVAELIIKYEIRPVIR